LWQTGRFVRVVVVTISHDRWNVVQHGLIVAGCGEVRKYCIYSSCIFAFFL